jgi:glucose-1-phosphate cytidylyltransferase
MKAVILAAEVDTRLCEEPSLTPQSMIEIGGRPLLWHIMKTYCSYGITDFVICYGYGGTLVKEYFADYFLGMNPRYVDQPGYVTLCDTGVKTTPWERLARIQKHIHNETFCFTLGDSVSDLHINDLLRFHKRQGALVTMATSCMAGSTDAISDEQSAETRFREVPQSGWGWQNSGFFVMEPEAMDFLADDSIMQDQDPLQHLARERQLATYNHTGFWQPMNSLQEGVNEH